MASPDAYETFVEESPIVHGSRKCRQRWVGGGVFMSPAGFARVCEKFVSWAHALALSFAVNENPVQSLFLVFPGISLFAVRAGSFILSYCCCV